MHRRPEFSFQGSGSPAGRGLLPPRPSASHPMAAPRRYGHDDDEEEARWLQASLQASPEPNYHSSSGSGSSGTASPQLWAHQSPQARHQQQRQQLHHLRQQYPASAGSSPSRAQAIAGYRREMLDLVRGLPEAAYELSLRDIVEHRHHQQPASASPPSPPSPPLPPPPPTSSSTAGQRRHLTRAAAVPVPATGAQENKDEPAAVAAAEDGDGDGKQGDKGNKKKQGRKQRATMLRKQRSRSLERSVSLDTGLLIKLFLPLSIGAGKKKKVSPKPDAAAKDGNKKKNTKKQGKKKKEAVVASAAPAPEEEWWNKSEFSEAGSSSRTSSTGSSNSNGSSAASVRNGGNGGGANPRAPVRSRSRKRTGCYAFFRANKGKNGVNQD